MKEDSTTDVTRWPRSLERLQAAVLDACFLAGFSERWFLGLVTGAERAIRTKSADDDKS
jgi:hypothetical protein